MGIEAAAIGVAIASTAASVGASVDASRRAKNVAAYQNAQQKAAFEKSLAVNREQGAVTAAERRRQIAARYDAYKAAATVAGAERGVAGSATQRAIANTLGIQAARETSKVTLEQILGQQNFEISNQPMWQVGQSGNAFLSGIQGGLQGLSLGMSLQGSMADNAAAQQIANVGQASNTPPYLLAAP